MLPPPLSLRLSNYLSNLLHLTFLQIYQSARVASNATQNSQQSGIAINGDRAARPESGFLQILDPDLKSLERFFQLCVNKYIEKSSNWPLLYAFLHLLLIGISPKSARITSNARQNSIPRHPIRWYPVFPDKDPVFTWEMDLAIMFFW